MINYTIFCICLLLKLLFIHPLLVKILLKYIAPIFILFALKHIIVYCLTKYFFFRVLKSSRTRNRQKTIIKEENNEKKHHHEIYSERQGKEKFSSYITRVVRLK